MLSQYKLEIESKLVPVGKKLSWIHPNVLTVIGIIPYILFFIFMRQHLFGWGVVMLCLGPIDLLDGLIARANGKVTSFGGVLDSSMDRVSDFLSIGGLYAGGLINVWLAGILLLFSFLTSYIRSRAELAALGKIKFDQGLIERTERIFLVALAVLFQAVARNVQIFGTSLPSLIIWILLILSIFTVAQRLILARHTLNARNSN